MDIRFDDKVVLVTGASTGIGAAIARGFGAAGARVAVHYHRSEAEARQVAADVEAAGSQSLLVKADVTQRRDIGPLVDQTLEAFGRIDILINNAGALVKRSPLPDVSDELYDEIMNLNVDSIFQLCRRVVPMMQRQGWGNIINVSSIAARIGGGGGSVIYASAKAAVSTLTRGLAKELATENIRVNGISPGLIRTPFHDRFTEPERFKQLEATIPMQRAGLPEECVGAALFLASDALSGYITGQILEVSGGQIMP